MIEVLQGVYQTVLGWMKPVLSHVKGQPVLWFLCFVGLATLNTLALNQVVSGSSFVVYGTGCALLALLILFSVRYPLGRVSWSLWMTVPWFLMTGLVIVTSVFNDPRYLTVGALYLVAYPAFYYVWGNRDDVERLWGVMAKAYALFGVGAMVVCVVGYPPTWLRFAGFFSNPNSLGTLLATASVCLLVWADAAGEKALWRVPLLGVLLGLCGTVCVQSSSRTSQLAIAAVVLVWVVVRVIAAEKKGRFLLVLVLIATGAALGYWGLMILYRHAWVQVNQFFVPAAQAESAIDVLETRWDFKGYEVYAEADRINKYSAGRINIWRSFLPHLHLFGTLLSPDALGIAHFAHMTILQMALPNGILAALCYAAVYVIAGVRGLVYAVRKRTALAAMPVLVIVCYGVVSLLESTYTPFVFYIEALFYLCLAPLFGRLPERGTSSFLFGKRKEAKENRLMAGEASGTGTPSDG